MIMDKCVDAQTRQTEKCDEPCRICFFDEIRQQPEALRRVARQAFVEDDLCDALEKTMCARKNPHIVLTGMGSSLFACYIARQFFENHGIKASAYESYELSKMNTSLFDQDAVVVAVSQSGESLEVLELLKRLPPAVPVIGLANYTKSRLYAMADIPCPIYAGTEYLTSTKSYTNTLAAILLLAGKLAGQSKDEIASLRERMELCADKMETMIAGQASGERISDFISDIKFMTCVGSGYSYTTASHSEIVLEEVGKMFASRYTTAQFIHGPIELIGEGFGALIYDFDRRYSGKCDEIRENVLRFDGKVLLITNRQDIPAQKNQLVYIIDHEDPETSVFLEIIPLEMGVDSLCKSRNTAAGQLSRIVKRMAI